jgi:hypothetical protein
MRLVYKIAVYSDIDKMELLVVVEAGVRELIIIIGKSRRLCRLTDWRQRVCNSSRSRETAL